jgi:HAMP domain-containing protein
MYKKLYLCMFRLLADCVQARNQHTKIEEDIASCRRLMETLRLPSLPDDDKQSLSAELTKLESQRDNTKKSMDENISRLVKSNSWPISPRDEVEEGELEKYQEMTKYVEELKITATEINRVLNDIRERKSSEEHDHVTPMDIDLPEGAAHLPERRRLSAPLATEEADTLRDKLLHLEERFAEFENDLNEHNQELMQEVKAYIEGKADEIASTAQDASASELSGRYDQAQQEVTRMGNEVGELAGEIGALLLKANAQETELATMRRELEDSKKDYITVSSQIWSCHIY